MFKRTKHSTNACNPPNRVKSKARPAQKTFERTTPGSKTHANPQNDSALIENIVHEIKERNRLKTKVGGRPSKLTPRVQAKLVDAISQGNYYEVACKYAGISYKSFRDWMARGEQELLAIEQHLTQHAQPALNNSNENVKAIAAPSAQPITPNGKHIKRTKKNKKQTRNNNNQNSQISSNNNKLQRYSRTINSGNGNGNGNGQVESIMATMPESRLVGDLSYGDFCLAIKKAEAQAEVRLVQLWQGLLPTDWKAIATFLERRHPEKWGRRHSVELTGKGGGPVGLEHRHLIIQQIINEPENREIVAGYWRKGMNHDG